MTTNWEHALFDYTQSLCRKWPLQQEQIVHWYEVCKLQFPLYVDYWRRHPDVKNRTPMLQEQVFRVPYALPSGRLVYLRGKWDSVDSVKEDKRATVFLQENKSKGDIDEVMLKRQLQSGFELQTMFYLVALQIELAQEEKDGFPKGKLGGVRYNVIRRPLAGGKHSIRQKKGQTLQQFYAELAELIAAEPEFFFMRWRVDILPQDIERFRRQCLDPVLETLCDDYEWWFHLQETRLKTDIYNYLERNDLFPGHRRRHFRMPYMGYSNLAEGRMEALDGWLNDKSLVGLDRNTVLFTELEG